MGITKNPASTCTSKLARCRRERLEPPSAPLELSGTAPLYRIASIVRQIEADFSGNRGLASAIPGAGRDITS